LYKEGSPGKISPVKAVRNAPGSSMNSMKPSTFTGIEIYKNELLNVKRLTGTKRIGSYMLQKQRKPMGTTDFNHVFY
jgi:hypothetical protein